jgi:DNA-directed RNA polymerase subunit alpha
MEHTLETLDLSVRAYNCLRKAEVNTLEQLLALSYRDLLGIKALGKLTATEIVQVLETEGLGLQVIPCTCRCCPHTT